MDWNNINRDRDTSGLGPIEYDQSKVPHLIRKHADNVRTKTYGQEVREAQARNAEYAGLIASEAESKATNADLLSKDTQNRFNDQIAGNTDINEVIDARRPSGGESFETLGERLEDIDNDAKVGSIRTKQRGVSAFEFGVIADGVTDDTDSLQSAIDYCLSNKQRLLLPAGDIFISKTLKIDTGKGHLNMDGVAGTSDTPLTVLKSRITDGSDIIHAFSTAFSNPTYLSNILINGTGTDGKGIYADGIKLETQNVRVRITGAECIMLNKSYASSLKDTQLYKTDGKTVLKLKDTNLTSAFSLITYGIDKSLEPTVVLENAKSTNAIGINVNGQLGLKLIGSYDNNILGYHEITSTPMAGLGNYSVSFDKGSVNNTVKLQTQFPVVDFGYNNSWQTLLMSNNRDLLDPKLVNDLVDGTFDSDITFPGANNGGFSVVDEPSVYSAKSIKTTLTSTGTKSLYPVNNWQSDMYVHKLTPGKYYIIQFSIKSNLNLIELYPNGEFDLIISARNAVSSKYLSIRNFPVYDEWRTYQMRIQYIGDQSVSSYLDFYVNRVPTGISPELYISDYVFIEEDLLKNKKIQKYRNAAPTSGTFLSGTKFEKSNEFGGYCVKESGTFKTISNLIVVTDDSKTARVTTGQASTLAIGDIVSFSLASDFTQTRIVTGVNAGNNTFTVNSNLNQAREYNVTIKKPVITES